MPSYTHLAYRRNAKAAARRQQIRKPKNLDALKEAREEFEKRYLTNQLKKNQGNISKTADHIGMERSALHRKLKSLGIKGTN